MTDIPGIALIGKQGVGKTAIAEALEARGFNKHSWATPVRTLASWAYGPLNKARAYEVTLNGIPTQATGREILQRMATEGIRKAVDEDFWVRIGINALDEYPEHGPFVNDDTRFLNELEALARRGWVIVRVVCPEELREQRLVGRDGAFDPDTDQHESEILLGKAPAHLALWNTAPVATVVETLLESLAATIDSGGTFTNRSAA